MIDVRKVVGDLIDWARQAMRQDRPEDPMDVIEKAEQFLASLPADGEAWYPSYEEVRDRIGDAAEGCSIQDEVIRATADLIRERGGQVGGEVVVLQYRQKVQGAWSGWIECSKAAKEFYEANSGKGGYFEIETRELIARQPGEQGDDARDGARWRDLMKRLGECKGCVILDEFRPEGEVERKFYGPEKLQHYIDTQAQPQAAPGE